MTAERWGQVKAIFHQAVECDPPARAEFLRQSCGSDQELQREVQSLLVSDQQTGSVLDHPVLGPPAISLSTAVLKDRYEIERELGRGGMSVVYLARDRQLLAKHVVVKVLLEASKVDPWIRQKFLQEMEALSRIDHPGVVGVLDTGVTAEGQQFLVMQYIEGTTLRSVIESGGMKFMRAAGLIRQIGRALSAAHEKGVWHRDLKPENIMLQRLGGDDHVKLIDFGIAGIQNSRFAGEHTKVAGSVAYMAPEQLAGQACAASDTYALGVVAYEILTGRLPPRSGESRPALDQAVERPILKALSFRPEHRQAEVRELSEELFQALTGIEAPRKPSASGTLEIAHVLCTGLVDYSLLTMDLQKEYLGDLQQLVRGSPQFREAEAAGDLRSVPTGDGIALAFSGDPTVPVQVALEVATKSKNKPQLKIRMAIHSGPVYRDVSANAHLAGGGINMAQTVMGCGDAGHILVSKSVADVLLQLSQWPPYLTDLGECTVKDGLTLHIYNLATAELGQRAPPGKLRRKEPRAWSKAPVAMAVAMVVLAAIGFFWFGRGAESLPFAHDKPSIAVLPFVNLSSDKDQEYFSDGLAEELLNALAKIPGLRVAGRMSSFRFRDKTGDSRMIGQTLKVATILEGSVRKQGNRARISTHLIKTADGFDVWSEIYDRELNDIFAVQEEIARAVTGALKIKLLGEKTVSPAKKPNLEAYNAYLKGRYFLGRRNQENVGNAVNYFEQSIKLSPGYAPAWIGLADARSSQASAAWVIPVDQIYRNAREAAERALTLDSDQAEAYAVMGSIQMGYDGDWTGADASFRRALALEPNNVRVIRGAGALAMFRGQVLDAIRLYQRGIEIDPLNSGLYKNIGISFYYAGRLEEAKGALEKALELAPETAMTHGLLGQVYLVQAHPEEALAEMEKEKDPAFHLSGLALAYQALGRKKESEANLAELIAKFSSGAPYQIAQVYAFRGQTERAFEWLERADVEHDTGLKEMKGDPLLKSLERDPRYAAMLRKMHL